MYKSDIVRELRQYTGAGMISRIQLAKFMGYSSPDPVDKYLRGLRRVRRRYFIAEVAERLQEAYE